MEIQKLEATVNREYFFPWQMFCLAKENKSLIRKLELTKEQPSINVLVNGGDDIRLSSRVASAITTATDSSRELQTESLPKSSQVFIFLHSCNIS